VRRIRDLEHRFRRREAEWRQGDLPHRPRRDRCMFSVMDFTTLYPSLPHSHIRTALDSLVREVFGMHVDQQGQPRVLSVHM
jgi:hypothetical protein